MPEQNSPKDVTYWMGVVDTRLTTMQDLIKNLVQDIRENSTEVKAWRQNVEERLAAGNAQFERHDQKLADHTDRIRSLEDDVRILQSNQMARIEKNGKTEKGGEEGEKDERFVTWSWVRDKLIMPVVIPLLITIVTVSIVISFLISSGFFDK